MATITTLSTNAAAKLAVPGRVSRAAQSDGCRKVQPSWTQSILAAKNKNIAQTAGRVATAAMTLSPMMPSITEQRAAISAARPSLPPVCTGCCMAAAAPWRAGDAKHHEQLGPSTEQLWHHHRSPDGRGRLSRATCSRASGPSGNCRDRRGNEGEGFETKVKVLRRR